MYITLEIVLLLFIGVSLVLKLVWRGPIVFLKSRNVLTVSTGTMYEYTYTIMAAAVSDTACHVWGGIGDPEQEPTTLQSH